MIHAFLLGPIETGQGTTWCAAGVASDGRVAPPEIQSSPERALRGFAKRAAGQETVCEPALAELAGSLGMRCAKLPLEALPPRATLAYLLSRGPMAGRPPPDALIRLFESCTAFLKARPWERVDSDTPHPTVVIVDESGRRRKELLGVHSAEELERAVEEAMK